MYIRDKRETNVYKKNVNTLYLYFMQLTFCIARNAKKKCASSLNESVIIRLKRKLIFPVQKNINPVTINYGCLFQRQVC